MQVAPCRGSISPEVGRALVSFLPNNKMLASPLVQQGLQSSAADCEVRFDR